MSGRVKFGDVVRNVNVTAMDEELKNFEKVIGLEHLDPGELKISRWSEMKSLADGTTFRRVFRSGQVLFGKRRAYQRKVAVAEFDGICSSDILVFETKSKALLPAFLPHLVQSDAFFAHALKTSSGSLSPRTRWEDLSNFEFELPSLEIQFETCELLQALTHLNQTINESLKSAVQLTKVLVRETFERGESNATAKSLGEIADFVNGYPFKPQDLGLDGTPVIRIKQLLDVTAEPDRTLTKVPDHVVLRDGDIVFSWSGTLAVRIWDRGEAFLNQHLFRVIPRSEIDPKWLFFVLESALEELSYKTHGTTMKHLTKETLLPHVISVPMYETQREIASKAESVRLLVEQLKESSVTIGRLQSAILNAMAI